MGLRFNFEWEETTPYLMAEVARMESLLQALKDAFCQIDALFFQQVKIHLAFNFTGQFKQSDICIL